MRVRLTEVTESGTTLTEAPAPNVEELTRVRVSEVVVEGPPGPTGPTGPAGPPGVDGTPGGTYTHEQGVAAETWTIVHNLGFYPNVTVIDSADSIVEGDVTYLSLNSLTIWFAASFSGKATLT